MVHFIWLGSKLPLIYSDYLAMKTATIHSDKVVLWVSEDIKKNEIYYKIKDEFSVWKVPNELYEQAIRYGSIRPEKYVNASDFLRYYFLYEFGGIYLDLDTVSNKPIISIKKDKPVLVGKENWYIGTSVIWADDKVDIFKTITEEIPGIKETNCYAPFGPMLLTKHVEMNPDVFQVVSGRYFHLFHYSEWREWFTHHQEYNEWLLDKDIDLSNVYVGHYNAKFSRKFCEENITPEFIETSPSLYARIVRRVLYGQDNSLYSNN